MIDAKMTLEVQKNGVQRTVYIKEGETAGARRLIITLTNNGKVVGVVGKSVSAYIKTPTSTSLITGATSVDSDTNAIIFSIPSLDTGTYYLELVIQDSTTAQIYSPTFCIIAEDALYPNASGSFTPESVYIIATSENFYNKTQLDTMFEGKQDVLTFDATPTASSDNPVKSGGVYTALQGKQNTLTAGDNITITDDVISADCGGMFITITKNTSTGNYESETSVADITEAMTAGKPIFIQFVNTSRQVLTPSHIKFGLSMTTGNVMKWYLNGVLDYTSSAVKYFSFWFDVSWPGIVIYSETTVAVPSQGSIASGNTGYVTGGDAYTALSAKEDASNKVTSISASSTDTQYPSAKCVYDAIQASGGSEPDFTIVAEGTDSIKTQMTGIWSNFAVSTNKTLTELLAKANAHEMFNIKGGIYFEDEGFFDVQEYNLWYYRCGTASYINDVLTELEVNDTTERDGIILVFHHLYPRGSTNISEDQYKIWAVVVYESETTGELCLEYSDDLTDVTE